MPRSPSFFGVQISFHALRQRALVVDSSLTPVHQKVLMIDVSFERNFLVERIFDM
jgi:hypothetical protein